MTETLTKEIVREAAQKVLSERSLYRFVHLAWPQLERIDFIDNWHIGAICEHLQAVTEEQIDDLLILVPSGMMKSLLVNVFWPLWEIGPRGLQHDWGFYARKYGLAVQDAKRRRRVAESRWFDDLWSPILHSDFDSRQRINGCRLACSAIGHSDYLSADRIVLDTPIDMKIPTHKKREEHARWWTMASKMKIRQCSKVVVCHRYAENDIPAKFLENNPGVCVLSLPMTKSGRSRKNAIGWKDPRKKGELLWPEVYSRQEVESIESSLPVDECDLVLNQKLPDRRLSEDEKSEAEAGRLISQACGSPAAFRKTIKVETATGEVLPFDSVMDSWQRKDFEAIDPAWVYMARLSRDKPEKRRAYFERPRGHSKTTDQAIMAIFAVLAGKTPLRGYMVAGSGKQAKELQDQIKMVLRVNPWLKQRLKMYSDTLVNEETESFCEVVEADAENVMGQRPNFLLCDELTHWKQEKRWTLISSGLAKTPDALCVVIANAGYGRGRSWHWKVREKLRKSRFWHFSKLPGSIASWITEEALEEQRDNLPDLEYRRLFRNEWLAEDKDGIPHAQIMKCTVLSGRSWKRHNRWDYVIGALDVGIVNDRTSFVAGGLIMADRRLELACHHTFRPKDFPDDRVKLREVEEVILQEHRRFGLDCLYADSYQAIRTLEEFEDEFDCREVDFQSAVVRSQIASAIVKAFRTGWVSLFYDDVLEADLLSLEILYNDTSKRYGLTAERTDEGHADSGVAVSILCGMADLWFEDPPEDDESGQIPVST